MSQQTPRFRCVPSRKTKAALTAVILSALTAFTVLSPANAQLPVDVKPGWVGNVIFEQGREVGRVFRDGAEDEYVEHWVLYPNYSFDNAPEPGASVEIRRVPGVGSRDLNDFLANVPFPVGSRYVQVLCVESFELPRPELR